MSAPERPVSKVGRQVLAMSAAGVIAWVAVVTAVAARHGAGWWPW